MKFSFLMLFYIFICSCGNGSLNEAKGELHYQNNISKGQEFIDLKEALDKNAITEDGTVKVVTLNHAKSANNIVFYALK